MSKFLSYKKEYISYVFVLLFGLLMSALAASASTTIDTSINTGGTLTVTGASTLTGAVTISSNVTVPAAYGLDTVAAGALNLGTTTATSVIIGSSSAKVGIASTSPYVALGVTGTTTASLGMTIGALGSGISQLAFGRCTPTIGSILASTTLSAICANSTGVEIVATTGWKVFVTPNITEDKDIVFVSASSTASGIQVTLLNLNNTGVGAVNPTDNAWNWMALR